MSKIAIPAREERVQNYINCLRSLGHSPEAVYGEISPDEYDGLLLPGGGDIDPARYGQEPDGSWPPDKELDAIQLAALDAFIKAGKPVLGICRGHQLINIYFGGTLIQDLPNAEDHKMVETGDGRTDNRHEVTAYPDTFMRKVYGGRAAVNSAHHQAIDRLGEGLIEAAMSDDGVVEAVYHETLPVWGVQFHPERMCCAFASDDVADGSKVIQYFLEQI